MHKFVRSLITEWRKLGLPFSGDPLVVAVSGGADSMSLLLSISDLIKRKKLTQRIIVAHFNHRLRGRESDLDEAFVYKCAGEFGMEFTTGTRMTELKGNLEQNARDERYKFLSKIAREKGASVVLTAHTKNDQAETFLMNLIRGSGADGLGGMTPVRKLDGSILLVRPLLSWATRTDTETYAGEHDLEYRTDRMNDDEAFTRVRIRKVILPMLAEINPRIIDTLAQTAALLRQPGAGTGERYAESQKGGSDKHLELRRLRPLSKQDLYSEIRDWLRLTRGSLRSLQLTHVEAIERLILSRKSGKSVELPGGGSVVKKGGRLIFSNIKVEK